jgi:hypothetical protein
MMKIKLSKNSWHYRFWTKCMKNDTLHAFFGERTHWDDALWDECYEKCNGGTIDDNMRSVNQLYDEAMMDRKIPQDLCTYMRNMMFMILSLVVVGAFVVGLGLSILTGFLIVPFIVAQQAWALWFADSYNGVIFLGVIAWFATAVVGIGLLLCFMAKTYQDNAYKDGTISYRIRNFRFLNMIPKVSLTKVYKQPWYVILLEYYRSIKEKTCKKIEFED